MTVNRAINTAILLCSFALQAQAISFEAAIDQSSWRVDASKFDCKLEHSIPSFGMGRFFHEAGERATFDLIPTQKGSLKGKISLVAQASAWQPGVSPKRIASVQSDINTGILKVDSNAASEMLASLYRGMSPTFTLQNWMGSGEKARIALSAANFQRSYIEYIECVDNLLPANYRQVARTAVLFPAAQWRLSDSTKERLDLIALYVRTDDKVQSIYVDGHSDNAGRRLLNRDLSKQRAEEVTRYLVGLGLDESMITTRYHGERYPVVANNSKANRARNRRVTIRLERD